MKFAFVIIVSIFLSDIIYSSNHLLTNANQILTIDKDWMISFNGNENSIKENFKYNTWHKINFPITYKSNDYIIKKYIYFSNTVFITSNLIDRNIALYTAMMQSAVEIYFNRILIGKSGFMPPEPYFSSQNVPMMFNIPTQIINYNGPNEILIKLYNNQYYFKFDSFLLGEYHKILRIQKISYILNNFMSLIASFLSFIISIYFFAMYIRNRKNTENIYIIISFLFLSIYYSYIYLEFPIIPYPVLARIQLGSIYISVGFIVVFFQKILDINNNRILNVIFPLIGIICAIIIFLSPDNAKMLYLNENVFYLFWVAPILFYMAFLNIIGTIKRKPYGIFYIIGSSSVIIGGLRDIFMLSTSQRIDYWTSSWGMIVFIIFIFLASASKYIDINNEANLKSLKLEENNRILTNLMNNIKQKSLSISENSIEFSKSNIQTSNAISEQAAGLKEFISSLEDMNNIMNLINDCIDKLLTISNTTEEKVKKGNEMVIKNMNKIEEIKNSNLLTIEGIKELNKKIESISDIVKIINNIADQTKIIAFNAELEASSAGENGKNFEIVATEIRRLADNTVSSTKEIKQKINEIQNSSSSLIKLSEESDLKIAEGIDLSITSTRYLNDITQAFIDIKNSFNEISRLIKTANSSFKSILIANKNFSDAINKISEQTKYNNLINEKLKQISEDLNKLLINN